MNLITRAINRMLGRMIKVALAFLILVLALAGPAAATELDDAVAAAHRGDYATALRELSPLAEAGDARAQFDIGFMHAQGWGVAKDPAEAIKWYRKAATQGLQVAQHFLGMAYVRGEGVQPDDAEAARWFARAAAQGFSEAQYVLGLMTMSGRGVPKDLVQAYTLLVLSGQGGVRAGARAVHNLKLTEAQRVQAKEIIDHWKPKLESSQPDVANPRAEGLLGLDRHIGEAVDSSTWPASAIGVVTSAGFSKGQRCTGTLVAPRIVLTAAHCLNGIEPGSVHFLLGLNKGTPASSSTAERLIVAKDFVPTQINKWSAASAEFDSPVDWALIVLKGALSVRPVATKAMTREELKAGTLAGTISEIGYGEERPFSPTGLRNCRAELANDGRLLIVQCLANFGYSGSPILAEINGTPTVIGIFSAFNEGTGLMLAPSASQFEVAIRDVIAAEERPQEDKKSGFAKGVDGPPSLQAPSQQNLATASGASGSKIPTLKSNDAASTAPQALSQQGSNGDMPARSTKARTAFQTLDTATHDADFFFNRGLEYDNKGQFDRAIQEYDRAIRLNPNLASAVYNRALVYANQGRFDRAILDYDQAIRLKPGNPDYFLNRGVAYSGMGQDDRAIQDYNEAIRLKPDYSLAFVNRGLAYAATDRPDRAIEDYDQAIRMNPKDPDAFYNRGLAKQAKGDAKGGDIDIANARQLSATLPPASHQ
jgi:tetratricopeptide (TPR) repeat protein